MAWHSCFCASAPILCDVHAKDAAAESKTEVQVKASPPVMRGGQELACPLNGVATQLFDVG